MTLNTTCKQNSNLIDIHDVHTTPLCLTIPFQRCKILLCKALPPILAYRVLTKKLAPRCCFPPRRTLSTPPWEGLCCQVVLLMKYNGFALQHLKFTCSPSQPGYPYAGWFSWGLQRTGTHRDRTKVFGFLFLVV